MRKQIYMAPDVEKSLKDYARESRLSMSKVIEFALINYIGLASKKSTQKDREKRQLSIFDK